MRDQAIAAAANNAHQPYRRLAKRGTPKNAKAAPVWPEGKEWYLLSNKKISLPRHKPFHSCLASLLLGRGRPVISRTELTTAPEIVAAIIMHSKTLQTARLRAIRAKPSPMQLNSINSGQSPHWLRSAAI